MGKKTIFDMGRNLHADKMAWQFIKGPDMPEDMKIAIDIAKKASEQAAIMASVYGTGAIRVNWDSSQSEGEREESGSG